MEYPKSLKKKVLTLVKEGATPQEAANAFHVCVSSVHRWQRLSGAPYTHRKRSPKIPSLPAIVDTPLPSPVEAQKFDSEKIRYELLPPLALEEIASVLTYGARKYEAFNWTKGLSFSRLLGATMRHLWAWYKGEDIDNESTHNHLAHAICSLLMLLHYQKSAALFAHLDDRPFKETPS